LKNILITGCNGLIGNALVETLNQNSDLTIFGIGRCTKVDLNIIKIDLSKEWKDELLPKKIDVVIHLAQSEKFRDFPESANEVFQVNTLSTLKLLEYARKAGTKKFIYASSGGVYGNSDIGFNEESPLQLNKDLGFYLTTKFCSELIVGNYASFFDINILRFFFVFGKKQKKNMLIPRLIEAVKNEDSIKLQGEEGIKINPVYVDDAAKAIIEIINKEGSYNVNIGGAEILSIKCIGEIIGKQLNKTPLFEYQDVETKNLIGDISKMKEFYKPITTFEEAIKLMLE
jgi:nucleoside-diphosphate-sugar epimerase